MDANTLFGFVTAASIVLGGLLWLVRATTAKEITTIEGQLAVERSKRESLHEMVLTQAARINGFEERIYTILERIESKLDGKADK